MKLGKTTQTVVLCAGGVAFGWFGKSAVQTPDSPTAQAASTPVAVSRSVVLAAPGRTEGYSEAVNVAAGIDGVLADVRVEEGQHVNAGDLIAIVDRRELAPELAQARATVESARAAKARLLRGSRDEERKQASADVARLAAILDEAKSHYARQSRLLETDDVPRAAVDRARSDLNAAAAAFEAAGAREKLVNASALPEELARADADIRAAEERARSIEAMIAKCHVRAPVSGTVVRRFLRPGEVVSVVFPQPIVSIVDTSRLRVRAEVDERDIGRVSIGQKVIIKADGMGSRSLTGQVASLGALMGRKRVRTGDPAEKSDRDVLEVLIDLNVSEEQVVLGLRVTVQFLGMSDTQESSLNLSTQAAKRERSFSHISQ